MIPLERLFRIHPKPRLRKAALVMVEAERLMRGIDSEAGERAAEYAISLAIRLSADGDSPEPVRAAAAALAQAGDSQAPAGAAFAQAAETETRTPRERVEAAIRGSARLRHALLAATGQTPADWDLLDPLSGRPDASSRRIFPGMLAYLEDIRSPFNIGSILRSADAFGLAEVILSPGAADPSHPRALRSSMGAGELVFQRRAGLEALEGACVFALELGGTPIDEFEFPERGIVVVGSEELGVSREALGLCTLGTVSIPMSGAKGSLNVGVAFGVLLFSWSRSLARKGISPSRLP